MCDRTFKTLQGLVTHVLRTHKINKESYYKTYINCASNACLTCGSPTGFTNSAIGYRTFCSVECMHNDKELAKKRGAAYALACKKDPTIRERTVITFKQTLKDNPEIKAKAGAKLKQTFKNNPEIVINKNRKAAETCRQNPHIIEGRSRKRKQTMAANPQLQENINKKIKHTMNLPEVKARQSKSLSIAKRDFYNNLRQNSSTVPCNIYLVNHSSLGIVKIGITVDMKKRMQHLRISFGTIEIIKVVETTYDKAIALEIKMHKRYKEHCRVQKSGNGRTEFYDKCIEASALIMLEEFESSIK